ncbi:MAG: hypothetical protein RL308_250, partial [Bacteroidota bacterium]
MSCKLNLLTETLKSNGRFIYSPLKKQLKYSLNSLSQTYTYVPQIPL